MNNKGPNQPAHSHSLICVIVIPSLESIISILATSEFSILQLVSVAEQAGLGMNWPETLKTAFLATTPIYMFATSAVEFCVVLLLLGLHV